MIQYLIFTFSIFNLYDSAYLSFLGAPRSQTRALFLLDQKEGKKSLHCNSRADQWDSYHYSWCAAQSSCPSQSLILCSAMLIFSAACTFRYVWFFHCSLSCMSLTIFKGFWNAPWAALSVLFQGSECNEDIFFHAPGAEYIRRHDFLLVCVWS